MKSDALNIAAIVVGVLLLAIGGPWLFGNWARCPVPPRSPPEVTIAS